MKYAIAASVVGCSLILAAPTLAQDSKSAAPMSPTTTSPASSATTMPMNTTAQWRASKLIGVAVYNDKKERVGDINEILLDNSGNASAFVVGVGGFLGMGERNVLFEAKAVRFVREPLGKSPNNANTTGSSTATPERSADMPWRPDHVMVNASKDQVNAMKEFKYDAAK